MNRLDRDCRHFETHHDCYYQPRCVRCRLYAYLDLLKFILRLRKQTRRGYLGP